MRKAFLVTAILAASLTAFAAGEKLLHEEDSLYHHIIVSETSEVRILRFHKGPAAQALGSDFAQSVISLADPYSLHMRYSKYSMVATTIAQSPRRALFIGLGAGTVPKFFARQYPDCQCDVAELDGKVVEVAKKYFFLPDLPNLHVTVMDGRQFVKKAKDKYDLIFLDAYRDEMIPFHLMTKEFLDEVKAKLAPGGVVISNIAIQRESQLYPWVQRTYQQAFPTLFECGIPMSINRVLIGCAEKQPITARDLVTRAGEVAKKKTFGFDLVECAGAYVDISQKQPSKNILTDDYAPVNLMRIKKADEKDWKY